jgi:uncharacterized membrane protein
LTSVALGWFAGHLLGRRVLQLLEAVVRRIPIAAAICSGAKHSVRLVLVSVIRKYRWLEKKHSELRGGSEPLQSGLHTT